MSDLMSLEPVDEKFRPLRCNISLYKQGVWEEQYGTDVTASQLRLDITSLLEKVDYRQIVHLTKGYWEEEDTPE
jgi:hypothetical protein